MIYRYILGAVIGGVIGGVIGHFGKCASGTCPMTSSPIGGAIFGAAVGMLLASTFGGSQKVANPSEHLIELKAQAELEQVLSRNDVVLVDFGSDRCPPCRRLEPTIHEIATEYAGRATVVSVDVTKFTSLARKHGVRGIPDVKIFKDGKLAKTIVGLSPKRAYTDVLDELLTAKVETE